jgi:hypothetical protein
VEVEAAAVVAVVVADKALQQARRLPAEPLLELVELHRLAADRPRLYRHCREHPPRVEPLQAEEVAVGMAPDRQPLQQWNGSFTSKVMARTARVRLSTM